MSMSVALVITMLHQLSASSGLRLHFPIMVARLLA